MRIFLFIVALLAASFVFNPANARSEIVIGDTVLVSGNKKKHALFIASEAEAKTLQKNKP